jgi:hypothetical protein
VERNGVRADPAKLRRGDTIEVAPAPGPNPRLRHASAIHVIRNGPDAAAVRAMTAPQFSLLDDLVPRGDLMLAGVVRTLKPGRMVVRTRAQEDLEILLRDDTRYFGDGRESAYAGLRVNERVFVRGGRNLEDEIEAYQVVWGGILRPTPGNPQRNPDADQLLY